MKFQACIGPGKLGIMHLRDANTTKVQNGDLVLCETTVAFFDYHGTLMADKLCRKCMRRLYGYHSDFPLSNFRMTAESIGVREIIHS